MTTRTPDEREDMAWANGVQACLQRLYAAGARRDEHHRAWEDCERWWRTRHEQVLASVKARSDGETPEGK
jgi:hypothetical protein